MKLYIKYMVSLRCKMAVKSELDKLGVKYTTIELGEVGIPESLSEEQRTQLRNGLLRLGLELMDDKKAELIEKIKNIIIEMVHYSEEIPTLNFSNFLADKIHQEYNYLSHLFSEATGITIEHYIISNKVERIKELLLYNELNLKEISYKMNYSSVAHLCNQFKKATGLTPSYFKKLKQYRKRIALEDL